MSSPNVEDIRTFAEKVERLCDFILDGADKDGTADVVAIQKLKDDARDLQGIKRNANISIDGLSNFMKGMP